MKFEHVLCNHNCGNITYHTNICLKAYACSLPFTNLPHLGAYWGIFLYCEEGIFTFIVQFGHNNGTKDI